MAVFTDNSDLSRQSQSIYREGLKGNKKLIMNALGYNKHGERTKWGKAMPFLSFGGDMTARLVANKVAKGTHAEDTMKATNQEYWAAKGSQLKFGIEAAKLGLSVAGGAGGSLPTGTGGGSLPTGTGGGLSTATPPISSGGLSTGSGGLSTGSGGLDSSAITGASGGGDLSSVLSGGGDISSVGGDVSSVMSGGNNVLDMPTSGGLGGESLPDTGAEPYKGAMESEVGQEIQDMKADSDVKNTEDLLKEQIEKKAKETQKQEKENEEGEDKLNKNVKKGVDMVGKAVPIIGAGVEWYQNARAQDKEEDRIKKEKLSRKVMANYNLL